MNGCFPDTYNLDIHVDAPLPIPVRGHLPDLSQVRRVVPEVGTKSSSYLFVSGGIATNIVPEVS